MSDVQPAPPYEEALLAEKTREVLLAKRARANAEKLFNAEAFTPPPFYTSLQDELLLPDEPIDWTVEGLHVVGSNTSITAGYKTGKTTLMLNLIKSLADGQEFLGAHAVRELSGNIGLLNFEVQPTTLLRNVRDIGISNTKKVAHVGLRGRRFDIMDDAVYEWLVGWARVCEVEVLILDPFSGAYRGEENSNSEVAAWTRRVDELKEETGISDLFLPVHTGRMEQVAGAERARGATKLDDWIDHRWVLARGKVEDGAQRYFNAEGRDIDYGEEKELAFDRANNALSYSIFGGTRRNKATDTMKAEIKLYVSTNPGCGKKDIYEDPSVHGGTDKIKAMIETMVKEGEIVRRDRATGGGWHHFSDDPTATAAGL